MSTERFSIIGADGLVGSIVSKILKVKYKISLTTPIKSEVDITDKRNVDQWISENEGEVIVLMAAFTDVEKAQTDEGKVIANSINVEGARNVAEATKKYNKFLIYISTDFVFPASEEYPGPYNTSADTADVNSDKIGEYAKSKLLGEQAVKGVGGEYAIVRISYPFGNPKSEKDFVLKTIKLIKQGYSLFADQIFTPTYIPDLAESLVKIAQERITGIYHVSSWPPTTPHEFGKYLANKIGLTEEVKEGSLKEFMKSKTPKPLVGGLVPSNGLRSRSYQEAIDDFIPLIEKT